MKAVYKCCHLHFSPELQGFSFNDFQSLVFGELEKHGQIHGLGEGCQRQALGK